MAKKKVRKKRKCRDWEPLLKAMANPNNVNTEKIDIILMCGYETDSEIKLAYNKLKDVDFQKQIDRRRKFGDLSLSVLEERLMSGKASTKELEFGAGLAGINLSVVPPKSDSNIKITTNDNKTVTFIEILHDNKGILSLEEMRRLNMGIIQGKNPEDVLCLPEGNVVDGEFDEVE